MSAGFTEFGETLANTFKVVGSVVGIASQVYGLFSGGSNNSRQQTPQLPAFTSTPIQMPVMPQLSYSNNMQMPAIPTMQKTPVAPTATEEIAAVDAKQTKRLGQIRAVYFADETPDEQTIGSTPTTKINEDTAMKQMIAGKV